MRKLLFGMLTLSVLTTNAQNSTTYKTAHPSAITEFIAKGSSSFYNAMGTGNNTKPAAKKANERPNAAKNTKPNEAKAPTYSISTPKANVRSADILNGDKDDFSPIFVDGGIMFVSSSRKMKATDDKPVPEDLNIKFSAIDSFGSLSRPKSFASRINSKTNEGPACFGKNGRLMFLTRNVANKKTGETSVKIFMKYRTSDSTEWEGNEMLPFELEKYNYAHPALSPDGQRLYFASNLPGGFGGMDLYYSRRQADGSWGQPINLGARVNTKGNEVFPTIAADGTLYFSSNGLFGAQGLDLFRIDVNSRTARALSLGAPFNSTEDDFGIMFMPNNPKKGFFSSNRVGGKGGDDIFEFELK